MEAEYISSRMLARAAVEIARRALISRTRSITALVTDMLEMAAYGWNRDRDRARYPPSLLVDTARAVEAVLGARCDVSGIVLCDAADRRVAVAALTIRRPEEDTTIWEGFKIMAIVKDDAGTHTEDKSIRLPGRVVERGGAYHLYWDVYKPWVGGLRLKLELIYEDKRLVQGRLVRIGGEPGSPLDSGIVFNDGKTVLYPLGARNPLADYANTIRSRGDTTPLLFRLKPGGPPVLLWGILEGDTFTIADEFNEPYFEDVVEPIMDMSDVLTGIQNFDIYALDDLKRYLGSRD